MKTKLALEVKKAAEDKEADEFELVGVRCQVIHDEYVNIFGEPGEVTKELADFALFKVDGEAISYKVRKAGIEILSYFDSPSAQKALNLNPGDKEMLFAEFPDICLHEKEGLHTNQI